MLGVVWLHSSSEEWTVCLHGAAIRSAKHVRIIPLSLRIAKGLERVHPFDVKIVLIGHGLRRPVAWLDDAVWWVGEVVNLVLHVVGAVEPTHLSLSQIIFRNRAQQVLLGLNLVRLALAELPAMRLKESIGHLEVSVLLLDVALCLDHLLPQLGVIVPPHFARELVRSHNYN